MFISVTYITSSVALSFCTQVIFLSNPYLFLTFLPIPLCHVSSNKFGYGGLRRRQLPRMMDIPPA